MGYEEAMDYLKDDADRQMEGEHNRAEAEQLAEEQITTLRARVAAMTEQAQSWRDNAVAASERMAAEMNARMVLAARVSELEGALRAMQEVECDCPQCSMSYAVLASTPAQSLKHVKVETLLALKPLVETIGEHMDHAIYWTDIEGEIDRIEQEAANETT